MSVTEIKELKKELSSVIKETIKIEMMKLRSELIPYISEVEQSEIEKMYGKPSNEAAKSIKIKI